VTRSSTDGRAGKTDWTRVDAMGETEIDSAARSDPDAQPTDTAFWKDARVVWPEKKDAVSLRLDRDVLAWFKRRGAGYQTRMNAVLRSYMLAHRKPAADAKASKKAKRR
jgi:uncharacterized protein (DUF4415 family)